MRKFRSNLLRTVTVISALTAFEVNSLGAQDHPRHRWQELYGDTAYQVSLDTANIEPQPGDVYLVWYQTVHATLREHEGEPWNREIIRSYLRCDPVSFKTVHITIFLDDGPAVAREGGDVEDVIDRPWKEATASVDKAAMTRACAIIGVREHPT